MYKRQAALTPANVNTLHTLALSEPAKVPRKNVAASPTFYGLLEERNSTLIIKLLDPNSNRTIEIPKNQSTAKGTGIKAVSYTHLDVYKRQGQGRVLGADAALAQGMVDGVATFDDVVKKMRSNAKAAAKPRASRLAYAQRVIEIL